VSPSKTWVWVVGQAQPTQLEEWEGVLPGASSQRGRAGPGPPPAEPQPPPLTPKPWLQLLHTASRWRFSHTPLSPFPEP
jgi:hypothetical protein